MRAWLAFKTGYRRFLEGAFTAPDQPEKSPG
jgi:hypothetical protein